jgi:hypothetical protein
MGPGLLMDLFLAASKQSESPPNPRDPLNAANSSSELGDRRQRLSTTGEIREYAAKNALVLLIGSRCPNAGRALRPNSAVERDEYGAALRAAYSAPHRERSPHCEGGSL